MVRRDNNDEYRFDKTLEDGFCAEEYTTAKEYVDPAEEYRGAAEIADPAPEFGGTSGGVKAEEGKKSAARRELIKKLAFIPVAAAIAANSIVFAAFGNDPLGSDFLISGGGSGSAVPSSAPVSIPEGDSFPALPNLEPDFAGDYAWSGMGSEEYVAVDSHYLHAGTVYTGGGVSVETLDGASYDKTTNTLTLNNYHGGSIDVNLMGNGFRIELIGENSLDFLRAWGAMYGGSVTFTGSGSLKLNESGKADTGLFLECEDSASALMIDKNATVEIFGSPALIIHRTTLEKAIYCSGTVKIHGGESSTGEFVTYNVNVTDENGNPVTDENGDYVTEQKTVKDIAESKGMALFDYSVIGDDGKPSSHVFFKPE